MGPINCVPNPYSGKGSNSRIPKNRCKSKRPLTSARTKDHSKKKSDVVQGIKCKQSAHFYMFSNCFNGIFQHNM